MVGKGKNQKKKDMGRFFGRRISTGQKNGDKEKNLGKDKCQKGKIGGEKKKAGRAESAGKVHGFN